MKYNMKKITHKFIVLMLVLGLASCHNLFKDDDNEPEVEYLVSYEMIRSYLPVMVQSMFSTLEGAIPEIAPLRQRAQYGIIVYKIDYKTTYKGEQIVASGLVAVPSGEGTFDMISYQNGTNTLHSNAPSVNPDFDLYRLVQSVASTGFVMSLPDYLGFGASADMFHPYLHATSTVQSVLDMMRAVKELGNLRNFRLSNDLYLTGYSMGGWATLQVQREIETRFSSEFNLKASAPASGPYDLSLLNQYILQHESYSKPYFFGYMLNSYLNTGDLTTSPSEILNQPYDSLVTVLYAGTRSGEDINDQLAENVAEFFTENYRQNYSSDQAFASFRSALEANSVDPWNVRTPTMLIHSTGDELVPYEVAQKMRTDLLAAGTPPQRIELVPLPDIRHGDGIVPAGLAAIRWFLELTE